MIGAHLQGLISPHNQSRLTVIFVFQQPHVTGTSLLPLPALAVELEELRTHFKRLLLKFFVSLCLHLLRQMNDRLEMDIRRLWCVFL